MVDALLRSGKWRVRGLSRNTESAQAKALAAKGVEMRAWPPSLRINWSRMPMTSAKTAMAMRMQETMRSTPRAVA